MAALDEPIPDAQPPTSPEEGRARRPRPWAIPQPPTPPEEGAPPPADQGEAEAAAAVTEPDAPLPGLSQAEEGATPAAESPATPPGVPADQVEPEGAVAVAELDAPPSTARAEEGATAAETLATPPSTPVEAEVAAQAAVPWSPYPGPRTFLPQEHDRFYGREREARDLTALIISERLALFYSQSGAGKSSLINTKICRNLANENNFEVLPIGRVKGRSGFEVSCDNIYVYNLLASLQQRSPEPAALTAMSLSHFLDNLVCDGQQFYYDDKHDWTGESELKPRVLIIDQFEEIFTTNSAFWRQREEFFHQLGEAVRNDEQLWVLLAMREDFIANLDPYLHLLPDGLRHRYYMQQLRREDALKAVTNPVAAIRPFEPASGGEPGAAELLVNNLLAISDARQGSFKREAQFVEPVQLQAVAYQLWEQLKSSPGDAITRRDVQAFGDVDKALIRFYEDTVAETVRTMGVGEVQLRNWFERELITDAGTRNMVFRGDEMTGSLPTAVADFVRSRLLVREIVRPAGIWYELIHDRFVQPVQDANRTWSRKQPLLQLAERWAAEPDNAALLLPPDQLAAYGATNWQALGPTVARFMEASEERVAEQARAVEEAQRAAREGRLRRVVAATAILVAILAITTFVNFRSAQQATERERIARSAETDARAAETNARAAEATARAETAAAEAEGANLADQLAINRQRGSELTRLVAENEARRLADKAKDLFDDADYAGALLLSVQAEAAAGTSPGQVLLFRASNAALASGLSPFAPGLRGLHPSPSGEPPAVLFGGPMGSAVATLRDGDVVWWPVDRPEQARMIDAGAPLDVAAFAPGRGLLLGARGAELAAWQSAGGEWQTLPDALPAGDESSFAVTALAFSPTGQRLAIGRCQHTIGEQGGGEKDGGGNDDSTGSIEVWRFDAATGRYAPERTIDTAPCPGDIDFLNDEGRLAWVGSDVVIEDPVTGMRVLPGLVAETYEPRRLAAVHGQPWLAVVSCPVTETTCNGRLEGWDISREQPLPLVDAEAAPSASDAVFVPSRHEVVALVSDGRLGWWHADIKAWEASACDLAGRNLTASEWQEAYPDRGLGDYERTCPQFGIHVSVPEELVRQCDAPRLAQARALWDGGLVEEVNSVAPSFDEWAGGVLADHLLQLGQGAADNCHASLDRLDLPDAAAPLLAEAGVRRAVTLAGDEPAEWAFQGRTGDAISLVAVTQAGDTPLLTIRDAAGDIVIDNVTTGSQLDVLLPADGAYTLEVAPFPAADDAVLAAALRAPQTIALGDAVAEKSLSTGRWRFHGQAGQMIEVAVNTPRADPTLTLFDPHLNQIQYDDDSGEDLNARLTAVLPEDGEYTLEVGWIGTPTPYALVTSVVEAVPLPLGRTVAGLPAEDDVFRLEGRAGDLLTVSLTAGQQGDAMLSLLDEGGALLAQNDDRADGERDPALESFLPGDGVYYMRVEWLETTPGERYTLTSDLAPAADLPTDGTPQTAAADQRGWRLETQAGDFVTVRLEGTTSASVALYDDTGVELTLGTTEASAFLARPGPTTARLFRGDNAQPYTISATIVSPAPLSFGQSVQLTGVEQPVWRFAAAAGDTIRAELLATVPGATLRLLDGNFADLLIGSETGDFDLTLEQTVFADGDYYLVALPGEGETGPMTLTIANSPAELLIPDEPVTAGPEESTWIFDGRAGAVVTISLAAAEGGDSWLALYDSAGVEVTRNDDFEGLDPQITQVLPADDTYFIRVNWYGEAQPYRLLLEME